MKNLKTILLIVVLVIGLPVITWMVLSQKGGTDRNPADESLSGRQSLDVCTPFPTGTSTPRQYAGGTNWYIEENNAFWITANATSSWECSIAGADKADLNIYFFPSSSAAYPTWDFEYSRGNQSGVASLSTNEWFSSITKSVGADGVTTLATSSYAAERGFEGTSTLNVPIDLLSSPMIRINVGAGGGAGSMYFEVVRRNQL